MEVIRCTHSNELIFNRFCLDCFTLTLQNSKSLIIQRIQAVKELLLTLVSEPSGLKDALAQNKDVTYHLGILLLNNLSINDKALVNLCCEAIGLVCNLTQHEVVAQALVRKISCLVLESSDLTKVGQCVHLLGKMLNEFHGLSWFIVSHGEGYLGAISSGVLSSNQSLSSDVLYTFLQVFQNEPRSLYALSDKLIQDILGGVCVVLSTGSGIDPTRNALALLRLLTSSQTHRHFLFFVMENPSGMTVFDAIKACIIHKETDFQIGSLQLVSLTLESELECQAQNRGMELLERFLDESFSEHIFESLISSNFLLLTSALRCLEIFEESKVYFNYKHVVYAVPSLIRLCQSLVERSQSSEVLSLAIQRLVCIFFGNNTALSQPNPVESYQSAILRLVETVMKTPHIDIHRNSIHLLILVLGKENVPKPLPVVQIKFLVRSAVEVGLLEVVSTLRSDIDTSPAVRENHLEKIRLSFDLMVCITRLFLESEKNPSFLLSTFASHTESSEEQTELVQMREIIIEFLKLLPRLESLSFDECPSNLLLSIFELFGLCFEEDILASALIYSIGDTLLTSAVHCRNLAASRRSEELLEVLNMFITLVVQKFSSCDSIDWLELIKCLPLESSKWFNLLSDRQAGIQLKKVAAVLIYLCDRAEKGNGNTKFDNIDEMKIKNLDSFLSDLLYDGSQIESIILKAVWYLVATNCPPSHNVSHQLLRILRNSGDLKEVYTNDIVVLEWSHGCDLICQDLGRSTLRFFIEYGDSCHLPTNNSRILESLMSIITSDCDKKAIQFAKMILRSSERHSDYLAELICESLTKIFLRSPKADYSLYALLKLLCECLEAETTKNRGLDERMVAVVVGNLPKVREDDSIYIDIFIVACDFLQLSLLHAKQECANRIAMLIASEANFTKVLMDIFQINTAKAKILNLVTTMAALLPPDFHCESTLLLDMDSLLSRLDNCPFEDMISGLQIFLLALKTNFNVSFVEFKVDDETLFFEVLLWKLENLAIKYSSIADDLIWVCIVEFYKLAHKKEFLEDMLSKEVCLLHILKLKFDVNSLLDLPYECLLFINVLVNLTYREIDPPLNDEMMEVFEFIRNKVSLTVKNMPCDFYQGSKSVFSEKDESDLKFPILREVANAFGISL